MSTNNKPNKRAKGNNGEEVAAKLLELNGYTVLERNFRVRQGEIDIIANEGGYLCFVEVKYRKSDLSGYPEEAVTYTKQSQITKTALFYMSLKGMPENTPVRFDVVVILGSKYKIIKNAFDFN